MPIPNGGLITETNQQYYEGAQGFQIALGQTSVTTTFNTNLVFGSYNPLEQDYALNNFKIYTSLTGLPDSYTEYTSAYTVSGNTITFDVVLAEGTFVVVQLKKLDGGNYGNQDAYGNVVEQNYNNYSYITLNDVINNFLIAYVGQDKLIPSVSRADVIFHAKRGLQEFSYDVLKSIKSQELTIPPSLSVVIPQDYVNYTAVSWIDHLGVKRPIYPANNLNSKPYELPIQDDKGVPTQDSEGDNIESTSIINERWNAANVIFINGSWSLIDYNQGIDYWGYDDNGYMNFYGQQYGLDGKYIKILF